MNMNRPDMTENVKYKDYTNKSLQMDSNLATMEMSKSPAIESSDQTKAAKHEPLVYRVEEIAQLLVISPRAAYNLCNTTKDFRVLRIGTSIRVNKRFELGCFGLVRRFNGRGFIRSFVRNRLRFLTENSHGAGCS